MQGSLNSAGFPKAQILLKLKSDVKKMTVLQNYKITEADQLHDLTVDRLRRTLATQSSDVTAR